MPLFLYSKKFTVLSLAQYNEEIPIIVLSEYFNSVERKRFTALHELGHIVLEFSGELSDTKLERYCDMFAGTILLVDDVLYNELGKTE